MRPRRQDPQPTGGKDSDELVLPFALVDRSVRRSYAESVAWNAERRRWFRDHGIDPADWSAVYPILVRSGTVHSFPLALERARLKAARKTRRPPTDAA